MVMTEQNTDIYYKLGEIHGDVKHVLEEAKKTNGRITKIETETIPNVKEEINEVKLKVAYYTGGFAVVIWALEKIVSKYL